MVRRTSQVVGIKIVNLEQAEDEIEGIQQEIQVLSRCDLPYARKHYESYLKGSNTWMVMEYFCGGSALDVTGLCRLDENHVAVIRREMVKELVYLDSERKIHRDPGFSAIMKSSRYADQSQTRCKCVMVIRWITFLLFCCPIAVAQMQVDFLEEAHLCVLDWSATSAHSITLIVYVFLHKNVSAFNTGYKIIRATRNPDQNMDMQKRIPAIPPAVSSFIVKEVLKNEAVLIRGCKNRMMTSNVLRKELWQRIASDVWRNFNIHLTPIQLQNHFNNRKKKVMGADSLEKKYQSKTGLGRLEGLERSIDATRSGFDDDDIEIHRYFSGTAAYKSDAVVETFSVPRSSSRDDFFEDDEEYVMAGKLKKGKVEINNVEEEVGSWSGDDDLKLPSRHSVSEAEIRALQKEMLNKEMKMFDHIIHMCVELLEAQRKIAQEVVQLLKESKPHCQVCHATRNPSHEVCDTNVEPSLHEA